MFQILATILSSSFIHAAVPQITATVFPAESQELYDVLTYPVRIDPEVNAQVYADYDKTPYGSTYPGELIVVARKMGG